MSKSGKRKQSRKKNEGFFGKIARFPYPVIIVLCVAVFAQVISFDFSYCDDSEIILNDYERISSLSAIPQEFTRGYMETDYYRPLVYISFIIDAAIGGKSPWIYHLTNIIFHFLICTILFRLLVLLDFTKEKSALGAMIFAVHPLYVNAVAWIVGRNDLMLAFFGLLSFMMLVYTAKKFDWLYFILHLLFFAMAALSKETALLLPLVFAAYLLFVRKEKIDVKSGSIYFAGWFFVIVIWNILRSIAGLGEKVYRSGADVFIGNLPTVPEFTAKFFLPVDLSVLPTFNSFNTIAGIVIIAIIVFLIIRIRQKNSAMILFGAFWFLALTVPGMFMTLLNSHDWNEYLECRAYLPSIGLLALFLSLLPQKIFSEGGKLLRLLPIIIVIVLAILAFKEAENYENSLCYYESAVEDSPDRAMYHFLLYKLYHKRKMLAEAEREILATIECNPLHSKYHYNTGAFYYNTGRPAASVRYFNKAIELDSSYKKSYLGLYWAYYYLRHPEKQEGIILLATKRWPGDSTITALSKNIGQNRRIDTLKIRKSSIE